MVEVVTISSRYQVVIPKAARELLGIRPGEKLLVGVEGDRIILRPRPGRPSRRLRGLHREVWDGIDPVEYVRAERNSWQRDT